MHLGITGRVFGGCVGRIVSVYGDVYVGGFGGVHGGLFRTVQGLVNRSVRL